MIRRPRVGAPPGSGRRRALGAALGGAQGQPAGDAVAAAGRRAHRRAGQLALHPDHPRRAERPPPRRAAAAAGPFPLRRGGSGAARRLEARNIRLMSPHPVAI